VKILLVYFSHSGNNKLLSEELCRRLTCDVCAIAEKKRRTILTIILDMMLKRTPSIEPLRYRPSDYQHIVFVAPIWGSKVANPMAALIGREKASIAHYSLISLCGHGSPGQSESICRQLEDLSGQPPKRECELRISELMPEEKKDDVRAISGYRVTEKDLHFFDAKITDFCGAILADS